MNDRTPRMGNGSLRVPFSEPTEEDGWVWSNSARVSCDECGEWIYVRRRANSLTLAFPPECQVCGAPVRDIYGIPVSSRCPPTGDGGTR